MMLTLMTGETLEADSLVQSEELLCVKTSSGDFVPLGRFKLDRHLIKLIKEHDEQIDTQG